MNYACDDCDFSSDTEQDLKKHMKSVHEDQCQHCNCTFAGSKKFKNHMCRINVTNPSSQWFYMKDWYEKDKCIRVFDDESKQEIIILHSEDCIKNEVCTKLPPFFHKEKCFKDTHDIIHLPVTSYMETNKQTVKWFNLFGMRIFMDLYTKNNS